ncbi:related to GTP-binding protein Rab5c [Melanopsichium pennsylvanicum]|uniref:Related to GTP-binding protein Rab5c n=2 Tax=Melanopsichium pennsylvanicum TaxID=63383 RepID=A0AAJ4XSZ0_9BASI|nr:related to GTP-binding protein Rab5c [Melanopsichium pennsylvanicum 4]SNX88084.1 related to GTP-binding protein Rab5c [Melanopsichium pennsylvanicum]
MTAQVVFNTMPHHPFPSAFSSPVATPSPTKDKQFNAFPLFPPQNPPQSPSDHASDQAGPSKSSPQLSQSSDPKHPAQQAPLIGSAARIYRGSNSKRRSRPRLSSLQSLNSTPASPSLSEQDSGHAFISLSRSRTLQSRAPSRNAIETLQPLAESSGGAGKQKATKHNEPATGATTRSPPAPSQQWAANQFETSAVPPTSRRSSTSPKLDSGLSEFGQMGAPFAEHGRNAERNDVSARLRDLQTSTGAFLRRSHTITTGISSAAQRRAEESLAHRSPPSNNAMTYGPSSARNAPKLGQRRQTVSNVSPSSEDRLARGTTPNPNSSISPFPSRTLYYAQQSDHPTPGSTLSATSPSTHLRSRGTLPNNQLEAKVVILGSQGVGKTSLVHRYTSGQFALASTPSTIGASFLTKKLIVDGVKVRLQLWDTAGQERFRSMAPMYYRGSHAAVIIYDITSMSSFMDCRAWIEELKKNMVGRDLVIHVVGAKLDLAWGQRQVELEFARATVRTWLQPYQPDQALVPAATVASNSAFNNSNDGGSSGSPTRPNSRLTTLESLANISSTATSRFSAFQRSASAYPITSTTTTTTTGLKPSSFGTGSNASTGSAGSDSGRDNLGADVMDGLNLSWDVVQVSEVSAKDDRGIEEVFLAVTKKLVERRSQIEQERADRERNSIFLSSADADRLLDGAERRDVVMPNSWTCCG